jgi:putative ABC transport system permease protein
MLMLRSYVRTAVRALRRRLGYAAINVLGLAVGLACCLLIGLYVRHELRYDRHHAAAERTVRVATSFGDRGPVDVSPSIAGPLFARTFSEVETAVRLDRWTDAIVTVGNRSFREDGVFAADSTVFDVFTMPFVAGQPDDALTRPQTIVLTESAAQKYFGDANPMGQSIEVNDDAYEVTGVIQDPPTTSHLQYDLLLSWASTRWADREIWGSANFFTYLKLQSPGGLAALETDIAQLVKQRIGDRMEQRDQRLAFTLQPLTDLHLYVDGHVTYVYLFGAIAALILIVASINFVNLATARSGERAREVGVRKTLGAPRSRLIGQFLTEAVVLALGAAVLALAGAEMALPAFESLAGQEIAGSVVGQPEVVAVLLLGAAATGLLAGLYPAFVLSGYQPASVLKSSFGGGAARSWLRRSLVVVQFTVSMVLIVGTLVVYAQLDYVQSKNLGYDREHVAALPLSGSLDQNYATLQREMRQIPGVQHVSALASIPGGRHGGYYATTEGMNERRSGITGIAAAPGVVDAMGLTLVTGEGLPSSEAYSIEERGFPFLINETMAQNFGWTPQEAVGEPLNLHGRQGTVRGVVQDFHVASLRQSIGPLVLFMGPRSATLDHVLVRMDEAGIASTMNAVEATWGRLAPEIPFTYRFLDDAYEALYRAEQRMGRVFGVIALLAILVACLGLVGLAAYTIRRRMKEISIRKVLGATVPGIVGMLSKEVMILVGVAFAAATPLAYLAAQRWLQQFAYATNIGVIPFLAAVGVTALLAVGTMAVQALRAARANPAQVLRTEN